MKKWIYLTLLIISLVTLSACNGDSSNGEGGRAPVYQGMIISTSTNTQTNALNQIVLTSFSLNTNQDMNVDDKIKDDMDVIESSETEYFAARNQDVYIRVRLNNPDSQVILRFKLNGIFYQISEFQPGSDSENLILKVNAGDVSGIKEFTIDEIKYIENVTNLTKDALFEGDRTVKLGVTYESVPIATLVDSEVKATSMSFNLQVTDSNNLIQRSGNTVKAYLFDGNNIIRTEDLSLGTNLIQFDNLPFDSDYEFAVAAVYDSLDGLGNRVGILHQSTLRTEKIIELQPLNSTHTSISFDFSVNDRDQKGSVTAIELYQGETLIEALTELSVREFNNLLSNNEYTIKVTYTYDLNDGMGAQTLEIAKDVTTLVKAIPEVVVDNIVATQETITFEINITDTDEVGAITAIELYQGETLIEALTELSVREFNNLLSNNEYTIKVTYTYDLNDGMGAQTLEIAKDVTTLVKAIPEVVVDNIVATQETITFEINITDTDEVGAITAIELYQSETLIEALTDLSVRTLTDLLSNNAYQIKVTYTYDLNDGLGVQTLIVSQELTTVANASASIFIETMDSTQTSIKFEIIVTDLDQVGSITAIELYNGETLVEALNDLSLIEFTGLLSNNEYTIKVTYIYDLNDGSREQIRVVKYNENTSILNGRGTIESPYQISTINDLKNVVMFPDSYFILINDIMLTEINWEPLNHFTGYIDGQNYSIIGLTMTGNYGDYDSGIGLFTSFSGSFQNVNFINVNVDILSLNTIYFGLVAGNFNGIIKNVSIQGNVKITSISEMKIGGIAGTGEMNSSQDIFVEIDFNIYNDSNIFFGGIIANGNLIGSHIFYKGNVYISTTTGIINAGGIIGATNNSFITDAYVDIDLKSYSLEEKRLGGLIGFSNGSFALNKIFTNGFIGNYNSKDYTYTGGLIGYIENPTGSSKIISNAITTIDIVHTGYYYAGNIYGNSRGGLLISNVYKTSGQLIQDANLESFDSIDILNTNISIIETDELKNISTYLNKLRWLETDLVTLKSEFLKMNSD